MEHLLTAREAAEYVGVTHKSLYNLSQHKDTPVYPVKSTSRGNLYWRSDLDAWLCAKSERQRTRTRRGRSRAQPVDPAVLLTQRWLSLRDLSVYLQIPLQHLRASVTCDSYVYLRSLPFQKIDGYWGCFRADADAWIDSQGQLDEELPMWWAEDVPTPEDRYVAERNVRWLHCVLASLRPREEEVIRRRYFDDETLAEIADYYNVTGEYVRQIERKALRKLRHPSRRKHLRAGRSSLPTPPPRKQEKRPLDPKAVRAAAIRLEMAYRRKHKAPTLPAEGNSRLGWSDAPKEIAWREELQRRDQWDAAMLNSQTAAANTTNRWKAEWARRARAANIRRAHQGKEPQNRPVDYTATNSPAREVRPPTPERVYREATPYEKQQQQQLYEKQQQVLREAQRRRLQGEAHKRLESALAQRGLDWLPA